MMPGIRPPMVGMTEQAIEVILSAGSTGLDLSTLFSAPDWASSIAKRVVVPAGVTRGSTVRTTAALRTGTGRGGTLEIVVNGTVEGCGAPATTTLVAGLDGGDCILAEQSGVTILGSGLIRSGGGAGGKGGNGTGAVDGPYAFNPGVYTYQLYYGAMYINWAGVNIAAGVGWNATSYDSGGYRYFKGALASNPDGNTYNYDVSRALLSGGVSGNSGRGQGHDGAKSNGVAGTGLSGLSGNGGDWGSAGTAGAAGNTGSGTAAGLAGFALKNTANITNLFTGTLQGRTG
jgi:hypothetical protein